MDKIVISNAVQGVNEARQNALVGEAKVIITSITNLQGLVKNSVAIMGDLRKSLIEIVDGDITPELVAGAGVDFTSTSGATVVKAIADLNKAKQSDVEIRSNRLSQAILAEQKKQDDLAKEIAKLQEKLLGLTLTPVTETTILGGAGN
jgi:hypothetical protein